MKRKPCLSEPDQITKFLSIGSAEECKCAYQQSRYNVIISVDYGPDEGFEGAIKRHVPMYDLANLSDLKKVNENKRAMQLVVTLILDAVNSKKRVLLHCQMGQSRSVAVAIVYIMTAFGEPFERARNYVFAHRRVASIKEEMVYLAEIVGSNQRGEGVENNRFDELFEFSDEINPQDFIVEQIQPQRFMCGGCMSAVYCGKKCQRLHWEEHKLKCFNFYC